MILRKLLSKTPFKKNLAKMTFATLLAQIIAIGMSPILTRFFSPDIFGIFSVFTACISVLSAFFTLRLEQAILLPKDDHFAFKILSTSIKACILLTAVFLLFFIVFNEQIISFLNLDNYGKTWLLLVIVGSCCHGLYFIIKTWANRQSQYSAMGIGKILENIINSAFPLFLLLFSKTALALVYGKIAGTIAATIVFATSLRKFKGQPLEKISDLSIIKRYRHFPLFSVPAECMSQLATYIPVFFINSNYGLAAAGIFGLTMRVLTLPINFIATSFSDVFRQRAAVDYAAGNCRRIFLKMMFLLFAVSLIPCLTLLIFGEPLFTFVFGIQWVEAGTMAKLMSFMFMAKLIATPLSYMLIIAEKQRTNFICQVYIVITSTLIFYIGSIYDLSLENVLLGWAINYTAYFLYLIVVSYRLTIREIEYR